MSVVIRLARAGTKKRPVYHVVVADSRFPRDGRFIERLGHFNPLLPKDNETRLKLDMDKVKAWLAKGAQPSDRVTRFLDAAGVAQARRAQQSGKGRCRARSARPTPKPPRQPQPPQPQPPRRPQPPPPRPRSKRTGAWRCRHKSASPESAPRMACAAR